jgi:uncharacterized protein with FMN-binding domain
MSQKQVARYLFGGGVLGVSATVVFGSNALFHKVEPDFIQPSGSGESVAPNLFVGSIEKASVYGFVQVQIRVENSEIKAIKLLEIPDKDTVTSHVSKSALPLLIKSALQSQSADIAGVSEATYTSTAFRNSLQAALMEAGL